MVFVYVLDSYEIAIEVFNALMFDQLFKINNFEYLLPTFAAICLLIGMFPESPINTSLGFKNRVQFIVGPTFSGICIILWLAALLKGKFKHQNER